MGYCPPGNKKKFVGYPIEILDTPMHYRHRPKLADPIPVFIIQNGGNSPALNGHAHLKILYCDTLFPLPPYWGRVAKMSTAHPAKIGRSLSSSILQPNKC